LDVVLELEVWIVFEGGVGEIEGYLRQPLAVAWHQMDPLPQEAQISVEGHLAFENRYPTDVRGTAVRFHIEERRVERRQATFQTLHLVGPPPTAVASGPPYHPQVSHHLPPSSTVPSAQEISAEDRRNATGGTFGARRGSTSA